MFVRYSDFHTAKILMEYKIWGSVSFPREPGEPLRTQSNVGITNREI